MSSIYVPFTTTAIAAFTTTQINTLTSTVMSALTTWQMSAMTTTQVAALVPTQLSSLNNDSNSFVQATSTQISALTSTQQMALAVPFTPPSTGVMANTPKKYTGAGVTAAYTGLTTISGLSPMGVVPLTGGQIIAGYAIPKGTVTATDVVILQKDLSGAVSIVTNGLMAAQSVSTTTQIQPLSLTNPNNGSVYSPSNYGNAVGGATLYAALGVSQAVGVDITLEIAALE